MRFLFAFLRNQSWTGFRQLFMATKEKEYSAWKHKGQALNNSTTTLASTFLVILGFLLNENSRIFKLSCSNGIDLQKLDPIPAKILSGEESIRKFHSDSRDFSYKTS